MGPESESALIKFPSTGLNPINLTLRQAPAMRHQRLSALNTAPFSSSQLPPTYYVGRSQQT